MLGVVPLFYAYAIMGVALWSFDVDWFANTTKSAATLFALLNGDTLLDAFLNLRDTNWILTQIYLYSFLCLFIYCVLNITITIMEDAYFLHGKVQGKNAELVSSDHESPEPTFGCHAPPGTHIHVPAGPPAVVASRSPERKLSHELAFEDKVMQRLDALAETQRALLNDQRQILRRLAALEDSNRSPTNRSSASFDRGVTD